MHIELRNFLLRFYRVMKIFAESLDGLTFDAIMSISLNIGIINE